MENKETHLRDMLDCVADNLRKGARQLTAVQMREYFNRQWISLNLKTSTECALKTLCICRVFSKGFFPCIFKND